MGFILGGFWRPWGNFSSFLRVPERCWNLDGFSMGAVGPGTSRHGGSGGGGQGGYSEPQLPLSDSPLRLKKKRREGVKVKMIFKDNIPGKRRKKVD